jgi:hypothetical protein
MADHGTNADRSARVVVHTIVRFAVFCVQGLAGSHAEPRKRRIKADAQPGEVLGGAATGAIYHFIARAYFNHGSGCRLEELRNALDDETHDRHLIQPIGKDGVLETDDLPKFVHLLMSSDGAQRSLVR